MENVINIFVDFYLVIAYQSFFSVSETLFSGTKIDRFLLLWPGYNFFLTIFRQIFLLRLNAINCAYCLSITMYFRYAVKSNRTMVKREVTKSFVSIFCCYCYFHDCLSCKASIEAQNVRES